MMAENIRHNADTASTSDDDRHGCTGKVFLWSAVLRAVMTVSIWYR
ncbi:hypothetical protein SCA50_1069 [Salmonella enterica subsp. enterica serovar Choleraesuis str. SCSA50]|uniref:Uncharacterized protein n=2 Tax=Salmonella enterica subsp. enterica serovar Choleraesuis TaxID=119912 RepID=Q57QW6_SALCH|nr:hypothetical protein SCH_0989 [Salmonella enterica subsp. enterica serovar Choleraesuis str. SC-B67]EFZ05598.1 hypothetical protein SCA50_1069 [Salmonella enterica subsp. enterica serovar Choleraesuis str. SCSA50]